jgi:ABC-type multidrug transport system fused ATPase/permease subunit
MACFSDVIRRLPNKIDSNIFEKGVNLSGGEKQRLALARGLMACDDKSIILLDEPTSSVDTKNELKIFQNIFEKFKKKSIVASIHRLHLLALFEEVYFFREGKVIASGSFDELLKNSAEFNEIWQKYQSINNKR